nr:HYR domain-containing protein [Saprospiraceae bacterium]
GSYTTYVRDVNDIACNTSSGPHLIEPGVDAILPQIVCPSNINVNTALNTCGAVVNYTTPIGTDNCGGATTMQTAGLADGATFPLGVSTNTFEVTDGSGNSASCSFVVTVSDNQAPQIICPSNINVNTALNTCGAMVNYTTAIGTDNCSGSSTMQTSGLSDGATFPLGVTTNTFEVTDGSGNTASCSFVVTVSDNQAPQIVCPSNINVNTALNTCGAMVNYTTAIGTDNCSGSSTMQTSGLSDGATFPLGVTTNTFEVTDGSGNSASCSFTITVTDNQAPTITCPNNITVDTDAGLCTASGLSLGNALVADNCNGSIVPTHNGSEPYIRGINNITWSADDGNGNISTCLQTVTVLFPEINLTGNGLNILNGDNTTNALDFTDFGPQSPGSITDKTFYIQNLGSQTLQLSGAPLVMVSGDAEFSIFSQPMSGTILAGGPDLSFVVRYAPTAAGNHTAMVTVFNNDCDEPVYTFAISSCATTLYYKDQDGDGYGNADSILAECSQPVGYVTNGNDCNDNAASLNIQPVVYSHDGICYATLEDALAIAGSAVMQEVLIHADASPNEINTIPTGVTVRVLTGTWNNHMMLKNNGIIILENGASFINVPGGVYKGRGVFNGNFLNSGGKVSPGE